MEDLSKYKRIAIDFSGGADSTLLMWELCSQIQPDQQIVPCSLIIEDQWATRATIFNVLQWFRNKFPDADITEWRTTSAPGGGEDLNNHFIEFRKSQVDIDLWINGITHNPPIEAMEDWSEDRMEWRDVDDRTEWEFEDFYTPYVNKDKRWVRARYVANSLEDLWDITDSCISTDPELTNFGEHACGECWWCKEREWSLN